MSNKICLTLKSSSNSNFGGKLVEVINGLISYLKYNFLAIIIVSLRHLNVTDCSAINSEVASC
jgi:hypothetical protein